jgi:hypothetical protein
VENSKVIISYMRDVNTAARDWTQNGLAVTGEAYFATIAPWQTMRHQLAS